MGVMYQHERHNREKPEITTQKNVFVVEQLTNDLPPELPVIFNCETNTSQGPPAKNPWSFLVMLKSWNEQYNERSFCGGSIVHDRWILTSARCCDVAKFMTHNEVILGMENIELFRQNLSYQNDNYIKVNFNETDIRIHPLWEELDPSLANKNDFCLINLPTPISTVPGLCPGNEVCSARLCLPNRPPPGGAACWTAGWGDENYYYDAGAYGYEDFYEYDFSQPQTFKSTGLNVFPEWYAKTSSEAGIIKEMDFGTEFAAGLPDRDHDGIADGGAETCTGDHGGPLVCRERQSLVVYGVTSWKNRCNAPGNPTVYANVFTAMDWIRFTLSGCPLIEWKGKRSTTIIYKGDDEGNTSYLLRQTVLNNSLRHPNIRTGPYTGFIMFSRRYCGVDFFNALSDGKIKLIIYDHEKSYKIKNKHTRIDGSKGSSVTVQYFQTSVGIRNEPWNKEKGNNSRKDQFFLSISGIPESFEQSRENTCFDFIHGVLPYGFSDDENWTECASEQKDAGF